MSWMSPAFPVGGFAYSHGLEWAQEAGDLAGAQSLEDWLRDLFAHGAPANDAILFGAMWRASAAREGGEMAHIAGLALALANSSERRLETVTQGNAFMLAARAAFPCDAQERLAQAWPGDVAYPLAVAVTAEGHGVPLEAALPAFLSGVSANLVSASVRLGIIGQSDGQRITARLLPVVAKLAERSLPATLDELGGAAFRSDLAAMRHETQYSRLFRS
jgi:urease accessory protein